MLKVFLLHIFFYEDLSFYKFSAVALGGMLDSSEDGLNRFAKAGFLFDSERLVDQSRSISTLGTTSDASVRSFKQSKIKSDHFPPSFATKSGKITGRACHDPKPSTYYMFYLQT